MLFLVGGCLFPFFKKLLLMNMIAVLFRYLMLYFSPWLACIANTPEMGLSVCFMHVYSSINL